MWEGVTAVATVGAVVATAAVFAMAVVGAAMYGPFRAEEPAPAEPAELRRLRQEAFQLQRQAEERERQAVLAQAEVGVLRLELDELRRNSITFPPRGSMPREDLIPAPAVPVPTAPEE